MRDVDVETWLNGHKLTWVHEPALELARIDQAASLANQARLEPLNGEVVDRYAEAIKAGDVLPDVIVWRRPRRAGEQLVTLGGNHRTHAHEKAGSKTLGAYLVECTEAVATVLMYEDNRRHGLPPSQAERVQQARHLVATTKMTVKRAAAIVGVGQGSLQVAIQTGDVERRARALSVNLGALAPSTRFRLAAVRDDRTFVALADLAVAARMNKLDLDKIVPHLNRIDDPAKQRAYIKDERARWDERIQTVAAGGAKAGPGRKAQRMRLQDAIGDLLDLDPVQVWDETARTSPEYFQDRCRKAVRQLMRIAEHARANA